MRELNLRGVDLNLLVVLDHLLEQAHVTRAADAAGMSQPAMSRALQRLRALLGDPLLARGRDGFVLTPRAAAARPTLKRLLHEIGGLIAQPTFSPAQATGLLTLAATDHQTIMLLPRLMARLSRQAPHLDVKVVPISPQTPDELARGAVDFAFGVAELAPPPHLRVETLYYDRFVTLLRRDHPAARNWSLEAFAAADHVLVTVIDGGRGLMDDLLDQRGLTRRIALRLPHFYAAIRIVATSDYVVTLPATIARAFAPEFDLVLRESPIPRPPIEAIGIWADALDRDPRTLWLRRLVREETRHIDAASP